MVVVHMVQEEVKEDMVLVKQDMLMVIKDMDLKVVQEGKNDVDVHIELLVVRMEVLQGYGCGVEGYGGGLGEENVD